MAKKKSLTDLMAMAKIPEKDRPAVKQAIEEAFRGAKAKGDIIIFVANMAPMHLQVLGRKGRQCLLTIDQAVDLVYKAEASIPFNDRRYDYDWEPSVTGKVR